MLESQQLLYHGGGISNGAAQSAQDQFEFRPLKVEPDTLCMSQAEELAMLRVRVQQLEREMARLAAENHHLKDLLVKGHIGAAVAYWLALRTCNRRVAGSNPNQ
ncbi:hypothetical protein AALO_G00228930 [Alosa alosa]|uniref:Uncharacterized protein n=1 Tax=Alosa alosa TaxID=278164 RepID=A0AAV6FYJ1_9TELE|nr:hypothetical protein AALO_G00228930 [Alosa alosa]